MTTGQRPVFSDGVAPTEGDFNQSAVGLDAFVQELLQRLFSDGETATWTSTVPSATDIASASVPTFGFLGSSLRVYRYNATTIKLMAGLGLQYGASGVPSGEWPVRVVRLDATAPEVTTGVTLSSLPSAGNYKRAIVTTQWRDLTTTGSRQYLDAAGNESTQTVNVRVKPEVGTLDGAVSGVTVTYGTAAGSASGATRPAIPSGHVVLAELLLDSTGLVNSANPDGNTSGITDLRPRLRLAKSAGGVDVRRATCVMDETTGARNARRMGAKAVGAEIVVGFVQVPTSVGVVTLDTSRDWRDQVVTIDHGALTTTSILPGGGSDTSFSYTTHPISGSANLARTAFYSGSGSVDGTGGYTSTETKTPGDGASTSLYFFADSTTGALKCRGTAHTSGTQELFFRAESFGPLGKRTASGVEA